MDSTDRVLVGRVGEQHASAGDMLGPGAELRERADDEEAAALGLRGGIALGRGAVILDRPGPGDENAVADPRLRLHSS